MKNGKTFHKALAILLTIAMMATFPLGNFSIPVKADAPGTETLKALKLEIKWSNNITATDPLVARLGLSKTQIWPFNEIWNGEKLYYEVYIPADGNYVYGMGAMDGQSPHLPSVWLPSSFKDQRNLSPYTQLDNMGTGRWIQREISFTTPDVYFWHLGPAVITGGGDMSQYAGKTSTIYYRNIRIKSAGGDRVIYDGTGPTVTSYSVEVNLTGKADSVTVTDGSYQFDTTPAPDFVGHATSFSMDFPANYGTEIPAGNAYDWYGFNTAGAYANLLIKTGDKLAYSMYIPSDSAYLPGMGLMDIQVLPTWAVLTWQPPYTDQNGQGIYTDLVAEYGTNHWFNLVYDLPAGVTSADGLGIQHIGIRNNFGAYLLSTLNGKKANFYYNNVRIIHADGSTSNIAPPDYSLYNVNSGDDTILPFATVTGGEVNVSAINLGSYKATGTTLTNIQPNTTTANFLTLGNASLVAGASATLSFETNGQGVNIGTGAVVNVLVGGNINRTYTVVKYGDLDGDGAISLADLVLIRDNILKGSTLTALQTTAGNLYGESTLTLNDLVGVMAAVSSSGTINQNR